MQTTILAGLEHTTGENMKADLASNNCKVCIVANIEELLSLCNEANKTDMILIDVKFIANEASKLVKELRAVCSAETRIVMTGEYTNMALSVAVLAGFDEFIARPFGVEQVMALLKGKIDFPSKLNTQNLK